MDRPDSQDVVELVPVRASESERNHRTKMDGIVTFRTVVLTCFAIMGALLLRILAQIDKTTDLAIETHSGLRVVNVEIVSVKGEMTRLRDWVYRERPTANRPPGIP